MRLADFILSNIEPILTAWETFARGTKTGGEMDSLALRDHAAEILHATARDMNQTGNELHAPHIQKPAALASSNDFAAESRRLRGANVRHAVGRLGSGFDMSDLMAEYRALRASVLELWRDSDPDPSERDVDDLARFNGSIDQSVATAVSSYTHEVDQARDLFLAILGHDLRNPLNAINVTAQMLPNVKDDPNEVVECGLQIRNGVNVMNRMIADLLDYTRSRLGTGMPVSPAPMDLGELGRELVDEFTAANPGRSLTYQADGDLAGAWDTDRMRQAMSNLLANAFDHGGEGATIELSIRGEGAKVVIEVKNDGAPIAPDDLPKIFDPLVRGTAEPAAKKSRVGSIGLGLYIAREVVSAHGGEIDVTSTEGEGTVFTILLPRQTTHRATSAAATRP